MPDVDQTPRRGGSLLAAALLLALTGCSVGPAYRRPPAPLPAAWSTQSSAQTSQWPSVSWWRGFGSATLDDYISEALANSDNIAAAMAQIREADAQARIAGAPLLPSLSVSGEGLTEKSFIPVPGIKSSPISEYTPTADASYEIDFWGRNRAVKRAAVLAAYASRYNRETVVLTTLAGVATDYFQALEAHDRLQVAQNNLNNAEHILRGLQLEQQVGTATALDVAQQASEVAVVNATIPPLQQQLQQSMNALAILLGRAPETLKFHNASLEQVTAPPVTAGLPAQLLMRRPDVAEAEANLHAANANIVVARAAFFPDIQLTGSAGFASTALSTLLQPSNTVWSLAGSITEDIFEGGALSGQYQYAKARYAELLSDYHLAITSALSDVESALVAVQQAADQQQRQQAAADAAQKAFDYAQMEMAAGVTNILTVLNTEATLFTAEDELVQVKFQHLEALVQLYQALGGGWQQNDAGQAKL